MALNTDFSLITLACYSKCLISTRFAYFYSLIIHVLVHMGMYLHVM